MFGRLASIRARTKEESVSVFRYIAAEDQMDTPETEAILLNLIR